MLVCKNCDKDFPIHVVVKGVSRNLKNRKNCLECQPLGEKLINGFKICKRCDKPLPCTEENFYKNKDGKTFKSYCKKCWSGIFVDKSREIKQKCVDYKGGKCSVCGYKKYQGALEFHHLDPKEKDFNINKVVQHHHSFKRVQPELDKCVLLCANCHREEHARICGLL